MSRVTEIIRIDGPWCCLAFSTGTTASGNCENVISFNIRIHMDKFVVEGFVGLIADSCAHCLIDDENYVAPDTTPSSWLPAKTVAQSEM